MKVPRLPVSRPTLSLHKYWMAIGPEGNKEYICARNAAKAVEIVEATYGHPPGSLHLDMMEVAATDLPPGATWLR